MSCVRMSTCPAVCVNLRSADEPMQNVEALLPPPHVRVLAPVDWLEDH